MGRWMVCQTGRWFDVCPRVVHECKDVEEMDSVKRELQAIVDILFCSCFGSVYLSPSPIAVVNFPISPCFPRYPCSLILFADDNDAVRDAESNITPPVAWYIKAIHQSMYPSSPTQIKGIRSECPESLYQSSSVHLLINCRHLHPHAQKHSYSPPLTPSAHYQPVETDSQNV